METRRGIDFLEKYSHWREACYFVTSYAKNADVVERVREIGVHMIPKQLVDRVKIAAQSDLMLNNVKAKSVVVLDDSALMRSSWKRKSEVEAFGLELFSSAKDLYSSMDDFSGESLFYVDYHLKGADECGASVCETLYSKGFRNIYISTGSVELQEKKFKGVQAVVGKDLAAIEI